MTRSDSPALLARRRRAHAIRRWVLAAAASLFIAVGAVIAVQTHASPLTLVSSTSSANRVVTASSGSRSSASTSSVSASTSSAPLTTEQS